MNSEQRRAARRFQSALPLRGATHLVPLDAVGLPISIRAPLAGSDKTYGLGRPEWGVFQSALPLRGATRRALYKQSAAQFQSALPLRGATQPAKAKARVYRISIRAPLAGSDAHSERFCAVCRYISIRAPLAGSDAGCVLGAARASQFQSALPLRGATTDLRSTPRSLSFQSALPLRGATQPGDLILMTNPISIRAPLAGSDTTIRCT